MITIYQAKYSNTGKHNPDNYIEHFPRLIIMNIHNCFVKFAICGNTDELCRQYSGLNNFPYPLVSVHSHEIFSHYSLIYTKETNVFIVNYLYLDLKME